MNPSVDHILEAIASVGLIWGFLLMCAVIWHGRRLPRWREPKNTGGAWIAPRPKMPYDRERIYDRERNA